MPSLYQAGWRQGSVFEVSLETSAALIGDDKVEYRQTQHNRWIVVSQDCDLDLVDVADNHPRVEIRPVFSSGGGPGFDPDPPHVWGVRSRKFRLNQERDFIHAESERLMVSPAVLTRHIASRAVLIEGERADAFTSWLGRRYDRPAVPEELVSAAIELSRLVKAEDHPVRDHVHDVLVSFDTTLDPAELTLWVITCDDDHREPCCNPGCDEDHPGAAREWAGSISQALSPEFGVVGEIRSAQRNHTPMTIAERAYSVDASDITFQRFGASGV